MHADDHTLLTQVSHCHLACGLEEKIDRGSTRPVHLHMEVATLYTKQSIVRKYSSIFSAERYAQCFGDNNYSVHVCLQKLDIAQALSKVSKMQCLTRPITGLYIAACVRSSLLQHSTNCLSLSQTSDVPEEYCDRTWQQTFTLVKWLWNFWYRLHINTCALCTGFIHLCLSMAACLVVEIWQWLPRPVCWPHQLSTENIHDTLHKTWMKVAMEKKNCLPTSMEIDVPCACTCMCCRPCIKMRHICDSNIWHSRLGCNHLMCLEYRSSHRGLM